MRWPAIALAVVFATAGCRTGTSYLDPAGPRYSSAQDRVVAPAATDTLRIVTFNVAFARQVDSAIAVLTGEPALRGADIVLLQEMDEAGTRRIAAALDASWVYYPAVRSNQTGRDFGNAVVTRWPIVDDAKVMLPHRAFLRRTQRIATAATIRYGGTCIRVYSAHLGTMLEIGGGARRDQLRAILDDAAPFTHVVIGGDMNSRDVGGEAVARGYAWPTRDGPGTTALGRWDHLFMKGLVLADSAATGTVRDVRGASDHRPVWLRAVPAPRTTGSPCCAAEACGAADGT
ncbi:MAG TPA: endonuclease/exonuclease/phosphatase family protein [Longimicrobiales bacterium]|nr:endonuclease/exonuclease/phosphatase family protein [Longimicrobiales bacterium]